jgi:hypothetical protein
MSAVLRCAAVEARSMEQAIDALQSLAVGGESPAVDKHPEKYVHTAPQHMHCSCYSPVILLHAVLLTEQRWVCPWCPGL